MTGVTWNLWHGCKKYSEGCKNCYVYRADSRYDRDPRKVYKTQNFDLPVRKNKKREYKYPAGTMFYLCFTSDFLLDECDDWRPEAWDIIRTRSDCKFMFITKRIERFEKCLPHDWGTGWDNVAVYCTCESQATADRRLPIFKSAPIKHKGIVCEPLLGEIDLTKYLDNTIEGLVAGGESGINARPCNYDWILSLHDQCVAAGVPFRFKQTGAYLIKSGRQYNIPRRQQHIQARKANINTTL